GRGGSMNRPGDWGQSPLPNQIGPLFNHKKRTRHAGTPSGGREARQGERSGDRESNSAGRISPPGAVFFIGWELSLALLRAGRKVDEVAILQGDAVLVGVVLLQVGGGHVEYREATAPAESTVRDIVVSSLL